MNLHEYQAKQLFAEYGLPVSEGIAVDTASEPPPPLKKLVVANGLLRRRCMQAVEVRLEALS